MEADQRKLQPVNVGMASIERGRERFRQAGDEPSRPYAPEVHHWRNNLTALSQRYNLYFAACGAYIAVHVPAFPFQKLGGWSDMLIYLTIANPSAQGYIHPPDPHAINHLVVGDLGEEEILLACTDSGNVAAYHTRSIQEAARALSRNSPQESDDTLSTSYPRPFFYHWVFESAWGLAIHKHARMIAVSANTPCHVESGDKCAKITIFAFGLSSKKPVMGDTDDNAGDDSEHGWHLWQPDPEKKSLPDRRLNYKVVLGGPGGHDHNIPNVSFIQSIEDRQGRWLLSTDIHDEMKVWEIWQGRCYKTWNFSPQEIGVGSYNRSQSGWHVVALDPKAFRTVDTMEEFCGQAKRLQYHGYRGPGQSYDLTNIVRLKVPGNGETYPLHLDKKAASVEEYSEDFTDQMFAVLSEDEEPVVHADDQGLNRAQTDPREEVSGPASHASMHADSEGRGTRFEHSSPGESGVLRSAAETAQIFHEINGTTDHDMLMEEEGYVDEYADSDQEAEAEEGESDDMTAQSEDSASTLSQPVRSPDLDDSYDIEPPNMNQTGHGFPGDSSSHIQLPGQQTRLSKETQKAYASGEMWATPRPNVDFPRVPILHCSASHIRLLADPSVDTPHLFCARILKQHLPDAIAGSSYAMLDRLNMVHQIPELGVVVIASQLGRCAVCTLTKREDNGDCGLRVDWVLPTEKQERAGQRPIAPLLGIAAGPIQGRLVRSQNKATSPEKGTPVVVQIVGAPSASLGPDFVSASSHARAPAREDASTIEQEQEVLSYAQRRRSHLSSPAGSSAKRKRRPSQPASASASASASQSQPASSGKSIPNEKLEQQAWDSSEANGSWKRPETSRRYRLMLTYVDQTVLTYELSREAEEVEFGPKFTGPEEAKAVNGAGWRRKNFRNRLAF